MMPQQPSGMTNTNGCILTVGCVVESEAFQLVMPIVTDSTTLNAGNLCQDGVNSFETAMLVFLTPIMSVGAYISSLQCTGMVPGNVPFRTPYSPTTHPGTATGDPLPSQVAALGVIYQDPDDEGFGTSKIKLAKTFFGGISRDNVVGNLIDNTLTNAVLSFMQSCQNGWASSADSSANWYRVLDVPKPTTDGTAVKRLLAPEVRGGIYTQKRRLLPRLV